MSHGGTHPLLLPGLGLGDLLDGRRVDELEALLVALDLLLATKNTPVKRESATTRQSRPRQNTRTCTYRMLSYKTPTGGHALLFSVSTVNLYVDVV